MSSVQVCTFPHAPLYSYVPGGGGGEQVHAFLDVHSLHTWLESTFTQMYMLKAFSMCWDPRGIYMSKATFMYFSVQNVCSCEDPLGLWLELNRQSVFPA